MSWGTVLILLLGSMLMGCASPATQRDIALTCIDSCSGEEIQEVLVIPRYRSTETLSFVFLPFGVGPCADIHQLLRTTRSSMAHPVILGRGASWRGDTYGPETGYCFCCVIALPMLNEDRELRGWLVLAPGYRRRWFRYDGSAASRVELEPLSPEDSGLEAARVIEAFKAGSVLPSTEDENQWWEMGPGETWWVGRKARKAICIDMTPKERSLVEAFLVEASPLSRRHDPIGSP